MKQRLILAASLLAVILLMAAASCSSAATTSSTQTTPQGRGTSGTLAKIDGNTFTLTTSQGPVTVNVNSNTIIQKTTTGALSDIHEGSVIFASGSKDANSNISATSIRIMPAGQTAPPTPPSGTPQNQSGANPQRQRAMGTVSKVEGNVLTLNTTQGPVTVNADSNTTIQITSNGSLSDLHEGESLSVAGSKDANNNITATSIRIQPEGQTTRQPSGS
jgi:hypothetical protein